MNQKGVANIILVLVIVILAGVAGYFTLVKKSTPTIAKPTPALNSQIVTIDNMKDNIDNLIKTGTLHEKKKEFEYSVPYEPTLKAIYVDQKDKVSKYVQEAGSEDASLKSNFYYDESDKLRFVLITGGAVNGSELEHKIYFNESGGRISESHQYIKGPGYTFPEKWPESEIVFDPVKEFNK